MGIAGKSSLGAGADRPGKGTTHDGILAIRWRLPSGTEIDTGFRADNRDEYDKWVDQQEGAA